MTAALSPAGVWLTVGLYIRASFGERQHFPKGSSILPRLPRAGVKGAGCRNPVICLGGNNRSVTPVRQMARAARPLNAPAESGRGALMYNVELTGVPPTDATKGG